MLKVEHVKAFMSMEKGEAASRRLSEKRSGARIPVPSGKRTVVSVTSGEDAASPLRVAKPVETVASYTPPPYEPTAADRFWATVEDWFCVRGRFAPKGMTREFAVATRWLLRVGSLLLVGAMAYFITLAINRGWIGPTQRGQIVGVGEARDPLRDEGVGFVQGGHFGGDGPGDVIRGGNGLHPAGRLIQDAEGFQHRGRTRLLRIVGFFPSVAGQDQRFLLRRAGAA